MQDQLDRIESKIDRLISGQTEHHGRIIRLETQSGFIKTIAAFILTASLAVSGWFFNKH